MPITVACPECGKSYANISDELAGRRTKCTCGKVIKLGEAKPDSSEPSAASDDTEAPYLATLDPEPYLATAVPPASTEAKNSPISIGFESGYASPSSASDPEFGRSKQPTSSSSGGPILSIISGAMGFVYGGIMLIFSVMALLFLFGATAIVSGNPNTAIPPSAKVQLVFTIVATFANIVLLLGMIVSCGFSFILGIMELSEDYRKPLASMISAGTSAIYILLSIVSAIVSSLFATGATPFNPISTNSSQASVVTARIIIFAIFCLGYYLVPAFVVFVGIYRRND